MNEYETEDDSGDGEEHECPTCGDVFDSAVGLKAHHQSHDRTYYVAVIEERYSVSADWLLKTLYITLDKSGAEIADDLDMTESTVSRLRDRFGIETKQKGEWVECTVCGDEKYVYECRLDRAENFCCSMDCRREWESEQYIDVECEICGSIESVHKSRGDTFRFCSQDCYGERISEDWSGENHPRWTRQTVACAHCGDPKEVPQCNADSPRHFCDGECRTSWLSENMAGEDSPQWVERVEYECEQCGTVEAAVPSIAAVRRFCGEDCKHDHHAETFQGQNHPNWKGGSTVYYGVRSLLPERWSEVQEATRQSEGFCCRMCGTHEAGLEENLHTHHTVPILAGGTNEEWNMMGLCNSCHRTAELYTKELFEPVFTDWTDDELPDGRERWTPDAEPDLTGQTELTAFGD